MPSLSFTQVIIIVAAFFALLAIVIFLIFLRPTATIKAKGVIIEKTYVPASSYSQQQIGTRRGFRTPTLIPIAESYTFKIKLESNKIINNNINVVAAKDFQIGQNVDVTYTEKGIPFIWKKVLVTEMK